MWWRTERECPNPRAHTWDHLLGKDLSVVFDVEASGVLQALLDGTQPPFELQTEDGIRGCGDTIEQAFHDLVVSAELHARLMDPRPLRVTETFREKLISHGPFLVKNA